MGLRPHFLTKVKMQFPKILFFIDGPVPTDEDYAAAADLGVPSSFRNAQHCENVNPEPCDGVTGCVPKEYQRFASAEAAIKAWRDKMTGKRDSAKAAVGGAAPKAAKTAPAAQAQASPPAPVGNTGTKPAWGSQ